MLISTCGNVEEGVKFWTRKLITIDKESVHKSVEENGMAVMRQLNAAESVALQQYSGITTTARIKLNRFINGLFSIHLFSHEYEMNKLLCSNLLKQLHGVYKVTIDIVVAAPCVISLSTINLSRRKLAIELKPVLFHNAVFITPG